MKDKIKWIAVDWGTTYLRTYAINHKQQIIAKLASEQGVSKLNSNQFENTLLKLIKNWLNKKNNLIIASGMVGSQIGWQEIPYRYTPCTPISTISTKSKSFRKIKTQNSNVTVYIVSGIAQRNLPDVMRGEETQIAGFLNKQINKKDKNLTLCLPGTHSKWVKIEQGKIKCFTTYMTGEIFNILNQHSTLQSIVSKEKWNSKLFLDGVVQGFNKESNLLSQFFKIRAQSLLKNMNTDMAYSKLSGILIGYELKGAKEYFKNSLVKIIGNKSLNEKYQKALHKLNFSSEKYDSKDITIAGLSQIYNSLRT